MRLCRRIAITSPAVVIAVLIPAAVAVTAPTHPPDPASTARAIAGDRAASFRALPIAPTVASARVALPWPDGPTWATARAIARHRIASFHAMRPIAPPATVAAPSPLPNSTPRPDPASAARAIAGDRAASFRASRPIAPAVSTRAAPPGPDGPTWAAALIAGTLAAAVAACLGLVAGRRTVRVD